MTLEREFASRLPRGWPKKVRSAVVRVVSLANAAVALNRGWAANHWNAGARLKAENQRLILEVGLLEQEHRIKGARMGRIPAHERPHYLPAERLAILAESATRDSHPRWKSRSDVGIIHSARSSRGHEALIFLFALRAPQ